jgi:hypothetical protein
MTAQLKQACADAEAQARPRLTGRRGGLWRGSGRQCGGSDVVASFGAENGKPVLKRATTMFVWFRQTKRRLQASLIETSRVAAM